MKLRDRRNSCDAFTTQLSKLLSLTRVYVDKTIHVSNNESLYAVLRLKLPLRPQTVETLADFVGSGTCSDTLTSLPNGQFGYCEVLWSRDSSARRRDLSQLSNFPTQ